ncbi:hypothetical protein PIB30_085736, partial [Stylosanthes scabra]|nr:hypothetical protein [Stylosanthes scabra]
CHEKNERLWFTHDWNSKVEFFSSAVFLDILANKSKVLCIFVGVKNKVPAYPIPASKTSPVWSLSTSCCSSWHSTLHSPKGSTRRYSR